MVLLVFMANYIQSDKMEYKYRRIENIDLPELKIEVIEYENDYSFLTVSLDYNARDKGNFDWITVEVKRKFDWSLFDMRLIENDIYLDFSELEHVKVKDLVEYQDTLRINLNCALEIERIIKEIKTEKG